jgi:TRAP-type C4-dicarboxylate transport system permease small subunit
VLLGWALAAVVVSAWLTVVEILWLPLRVDGVLVPVSVVAAVVGNLLLVWGAHRWSRSRIVAVLPALVWMVLTIAASRRRAEGDLLIIGGGASGIVNLAFLLLGVVAAVFAVARVLSPRRRRGSTRTGGQPPASR